MNRILSNLFLIALAIFTSLPTHARDLKLELPISTAMNNARWRASIGSGFTYSFGPMVPGSMRIIEADVKANEYARPYYIQDGRNYNRDEASTCNEAFRNALTYATSNAQAKGANHLNVLYTTFFNEKPINIKSHFVCNSGLSSSSVDMVVSYAVSQAPAPVGAITALPVTTETPAKPIAPAAAPRPLPVASGFADVYDIAKIPFINESCKKVYAEWLTKPNPKAIAISPKGNCNSAWGAAGKDQSLLSDPTLRALASCNARTQGANDCAVYAVDGVVVWKP